MISSGHEATPGDFRAEHGPVGQGRIPGGRVAAWYSPYRCHTVSTYFKNFYEAVKDSG